MRHVDASKYTTKIAQYMTKKFKKTKKIEYTTLAKYKMCFAQYIYDNLNL